MMSSVSSSNKYLSLILLLIVVISGCSHWIRKPMEPEPKIYDQQAMELFVEATIAEEVEDYYRAVVLYQEALRHDSTSPTIHLTLASLHQHLGQYESALHHLKTAADLSPEDYRIMEWIVELLGDQERWSDQKPYIDRLLELNPDNITYNLQLANIHLQAGEGKTARRIFRRVIKLADDNKDALIRLGVVLLYNDEPELAELCYHRAVEIDPVDDRAHFTLGQIYLNLDRERDAVKHFEMAIAVNDTVVRYWTALAYLELDAKQYQQSEDILRRALIALPDHPRLLDLLGSVLERQERYQEALDVLYRSVEIDTTSIAPYITIGFIYDETDRFDMAESTYQDALNIDPENPTVLNNYAYLLAARGIRLDEALTMSEKVMEIDPENSSYLDTIGWIYYKQGNPAQALEYLLKALEITDEDNAELFDHIGDVYFDLDEYSNAQNYWKRALNIEPDNQTIKDKLDQPTMIHN